MQSVKTHDLEILLRLSGIEDRIITRYKSEWIVVLRWDPETRYQTAGHSTDQQANEMIASAARLLDAL